jgi:hypothetical protein
LRPRDEWHRSIPQVLSRIPWSINGTITVAGKIVASDRSVLAGLVNGAGKTAFDISTNAYPGTSRC